MEGGGSGVGAYRFMLEQNLGKTMLEFQVKTSPPKGALEI